MQKDDIKERIGKDKVYLSDGTINIPFLKQCLQKQMVLEYGVLKQIIIRFQNIMKLQANLLKLKEPIKIIGDIHGQYYDLLKILSFRPNFEESSEEKILFLGDYVDRGINGTEINYPKQVFLLRGNHQSRLITQTYNFFQEFTMKYSQDLYFDIMDVFDLLPIAAIVNDKYFCVHAGITPNMVKWTDIQKINETDRFMEIPITGQICDYMWSDPVCAEDGSCQGLYQENNARGCSIYYGAELAQKFLKRHKLHMIIRAHEITNLDGYVKHIWPGWNNYPTVITIFSAPNYCGTHQNKGVILSFKNGRMELKQLNQQSKVNSLFQSNNFFDLTFLKLLSDVDKFAKNLTRAFCKKHFKDQKKASEQTKIQLILMYGEQNQMEKKNTLRPLLKKVSLMEQHNELYHKQLQQSFISRQSQTANHCFRSSIAYFADSQKMPLKTTYRSAMSKGSKK